MQRKKDYDNPVFARSYTITLCRREVPLAIGALAAGELMTDTLTKELIQIVDLQFFDQKPDANLSLKVTFRNGHTLVYVSKDTLLLDVRDIDEVDNWKLVFTRAE